MGSVFGVVHSPLQTGFFAYKEEHITPHPPTKSRRSSASLHRCVGEIEIEFKECACAGCIYLCQEYECLSALYAMVCLCLRADSLFWLRSAKTGNVSHLIRWLLLRRESEKE